MTRTEQDYINFIKSKVSQEELLCQIAEEASELAQAALKLKRAREGTNPTPASAARAFINLCGEAGDVLNALRVYDSTLVYTHEEDDYKLRR